MYLQPLVDELKSLWDDGLPTFDSFKDLHLKKKLLPCELHTIVDYQ